MIVSVQKEILTEGEYCDSCPQLLNQGNEFHENVRCMAFGQQLDSRLVDYHTRIMRCQGCREAEGSLSAELELELCPFCGQAPTLRVRHCRQFWHGGEQEDYRGYIHCGCGARFDVIYDSEEKAKRYLIYKWNKRTLRKAIKKKEKIRP